MLKIKNANNTTIEAINERLMDDKRLLELGHLEPAKQIANDVLSTHHRGVSSVYYEIADFLLSCGQPEIAQDYYRLSLEISLIPSNYSRYLQCLLLSPSCNDEKMYREALKYDNFFSHIKRYQYYSNDIRSNKKLNIGYVCHFFQNNISRSLLIPFIKAHDRQRVKIFCYSDAIPDEVKKDIRGAADVWRDTKELDDKKLAKLIHKDQIDILLELNGHSVINRYGVIARKPAPIQVSYYNIPATSGVSAIDYILVGDETALDEAKPYYTESIYYLKGVKNVAEFQDFPDCSPLPCLTNQYITFGSFGEAHKVNSEVIKLWCKVLKKIPDARFYMKASVLGYDNQLNAYKKLFENENIDINRVYFEGFSEHKKMLACYSKIDIAFATFPHGGGATTMEALWQGVPVLSLYGNRYAFQYGKMVLSSISHPELVAYSEEEFVNKAVELANDKERLLKYRHQLREDFRRSPRADVLAFSAKLEDAYHDMWARYCDSQVSKKNYLSVVKDYFRKLKSQ